MKQVLWWSLILATLGAEVPRARAALAEFSGPLRRTTLTIKADGSAQLRNESVQGRPAVEQQIRTVEQWQRRAEAADDEETNANPAEEAKPPKPFTDQELSAKLREQTEKRQGIGQEAETKLETVQVTTNWVRTVTTRAFGTLEEMLQQGYRLWGESGLLFSNLRLEMDAEGRLKVTLEPHASGSRQAKAIRAQRKSMRVRSELRLMFPGKVISSGLPHTEGEATWIEIDSQNDESLDAALKLYEAPIVIIVEAGGLKLDQPLESKALMDLTSRQDSSTKELPITDAGPGFVAEPLSVSTTTIYFFPDGEKYLKGRQSHFGQSTGTVVNAKLFAPRGRTFQSVSGLRVLKATDDQGRLVAPVSEESATSFSGGAARASQMPVNFRLELPRPDAQTIEELSAEAIVVTVGQWREVTLTNVQADAQKELDVSPALSGARMTISKVSAKNGQLTVQAQIKGPPEIRQLELQCKVPGVRRFSPYTQERGFSVKDGQAVRNLTIQGYGLESDLEDPARNLSVVVRFPADLKRERVKFKLTGLDLF
jgi:hypothetical protein